MIVRGVVVRFKVLGLIQTILLVLLLMHLLELGASLPTGLFHGDGRDGAVTIVAQAVVGLAELGLEGYRTLFILDVLAAVTRLQLDR